MFPSFCIKHTRRHLQVCISPHRYESVSSVFKEIIDNASHLIVPLEFWVYVDLI